MRLETVKQKVVKELCRHKIGNKINVSSFYLERHLIPSGEGSLSVTRYIRQLRNEKALRYPDPRANNHKYLITVDKRRKIWR